MRVEYHIKCIYFQEYTEPNAFGTDKSADFGRLSSSSSLSSLRRRRCCVVVVVASSSLLRRRRCYVVVRCVADFDEVERRRMAHSCCSASPRLSQPRELSAWRDPCFHVLSRCISAHNVPVSSSNRHALLYLLLQMRSVLGRLCSYFFDIDILAGRNQEWTWE